jgi:hypothetical protein
MQTHIQSRKAAWFAVAALLTSVPALAQGNEAEQRRLCTGDAMRLCSTEIPNVELVTACMRKQKASLSEGCRSVFDQDQVSSATPARSRD